MPEHKYRPEQQAEEAKKLFNPDDPYGVKAVLAEKERQYKEAAKKPKEPSALRWLVIFAPMYLLVAMPFAIWLKDMYERPDGQLSRDQEKAFTADDKIDYLRDDTTAAVQIPATPAAPVPAVVQSTPVAAAATPAAAARPAVPVGPLELFQSDPFTALGELFAQSGAAEIRSFFDHDLVAQAFAERLKKGGGWNTPEGLLKYADTGDGRRLLVAFSSQRGKPDIAAAVIGSKSFSMFAQSPAVKALNASPYKYAAYFSANKGLEQLLTAPATYQLLSEHPGTASFMRSVSLFIGPAMGVKSGVRKASRRNH